MPCILLSAYVLTLALGEYLWTFEGVLGTVRASTSS
jgi:hypothetical protein